MLFQMQYPASFFANERPEARRADCFNPAGFAKMTVRVWIGSAELANSVASQRSAMTNRVLKFYFPKKFNTLYVFQRNIFSVSDIHQKAVILYRIGYKYEFFANTRT
jgi:hypothetical protein